MNHSRGSLAAASLLAATAAGTTWFAMWAWHGLSTTPGGYLNPLFLLALVIGGIGIVTRWWRWPGPAVVATQVVVSGMLTSLILCGSPLPIGGAWTELHTKISQAVDTANAYAAPVPPEAPPIDVLLIGAGLACLLLVDLFACTAHRVSLAGLPLLAIFSIPVTMIGDPVSWWIFALTTAGFLTMLFLQESDHVTRWGRPLGEDRETGDPIAFGAGTSTVRSTAGLVGGAATALAVLLPVMLPATGLHVFDIGPGHGGGDDIRIENPVTDLVRDLKRGDDVPLITVTTTDPDPSYLRILTLTRYTDAAWTPGDRDVPADNLANGLMPPPQGVSTQVKRHEYPYDVTVGSNFDSRWLPTQPPISRIDAEGDWRYDDRTQDFLAGDDDLSTAGLRYTMTAVDLDVTSETLADSGTPNGKVDDTFSEVPSDMPSMVRDLAIEVTDGATTSYDKAVALQNWFRDDGGFTYSLDTHEGNGTDALVDFLSTGPGGRTGYCEQFASAMAIMARMLGIPARVGVGFLAPTAAGPNTWVYSSHDMHAWPELYFDGAGWVRFEPTPAGRATDVPAYTVPGAPETDGPSASAPTDTSEPSTSRNARPEDLQSDVAAADRNSGSGGSFPWLPTLVGLVLLLAVAASLLLPRAVRGRRRERRLASGAVEPVWAELRDTAVDLGVPWPTGRSPRATRDALVDHLGAPVDATTVDRPAHGPEIAPEAVSALDRLVLTLELDRYSRAGAQLDPVRLRADGETCVSALAGGATRSARRRATWWPRTVLTFTRRRTRPSVDPLEARYGGVVDHVS